MLLTRHDARGMARYEHFPQHCSGRSQDLDRSWRHHHGCRVNLPKKNKLDKPRYQDYQAEEIKTVEEEGLKVRVMAGNYKGAAGPVYMRNPGMLLDVHIQPGATFTHQVRPSVHQNP